MNSKQRLAIWLLVLILIVPSMASAVKKGRLIGKIVDPEGNPVAEVTIIATCEGVPSFRETEMTNKKGVFKLDFARSVRAVAQLVLEPLQEETIALAVGHDEKPGKTAETAVGGGKPQPAHKDQLADMGQAGVAGIKRNGGGFDPDLFGRHGGCEG